jgi:hypothetical protein
VSRRRRHTANRFCMTCTPSEIAAAALTTSAIMSGTAWVPYAFERDALDQRHEISCWHCVAQELHHARHRAQVQRRSDRRNHAGDDHVARLERLVVHTRVCGTRVMTARFGVVRSAAAKQQRDRGECPACRRLDLPHPVDPRIASAELRPSPSDKPDRLSPTPVPVWSQVRRALPRHSHRQSRAFTMRLVRVRWSRSVNDRQR